jgi:filamentous hemagglutinin family protein
VNKAFSPLFHLSLCTLGCLYASSTQAQVTSDGTVNTQVDQQGNVAEITGGETRGSNLFHSFRDFSVGTGETASFLNSNDIANIFSRVTGGNISSIDGLIQSNGSANLFLINPAGILFGENARLDIGGSFLGSTADSVLFEDGEFNATDLDNPPVLTINAPIGLGFRDNPGDITVRGNGDGTRTTSDLIDTQDALRVSSNKTFSLLGGKLLFEGATIKTAGGRIELGSVEGNEQVSLTPASEGFSLGYEGVQNFRDIQLSQTAIVDASGLVAGDIRVQGKNISLLKGSQFEASTIGDSTSQDIPGTIKINAIDTIDIEGENPLNGFPSAIFSQVYLESVGNTKEINISTINLAISNGGEISTSTYGKGNGGKITVNASDSVIVKNASQITSQVFGQGNSGDININAQGKVSFDGRDETDSFPSAIFTSIEPDGEGNGGNINIQAESLEITNRAQLLSNVEGIGDAGDINIQVANEVNLINSIMISEVTAPDENGEGGRGDGGDINITTGSLFLRDGSSLLADTENIGNAGDISIQASTQVVLKGEGRSAFANSTDIVPSQITTTVDGETNPDVIGNAGDININTRSLSISDEGFIRASTSGSGNAGNLNIGSKESPVKNLSLVNDATISASTFSTGNAGNLTIFAESLVLESGAELQAISFDNGNAGNLTVNALESVKISGTASDGLSPSGIFASAFDGTGNGGNLTIATDELIVQDKGTVTVGNFQIVFGEVIPLPPGSGVPGNLNIEANSITLNNEGRIDAATQSEIGKGGIINLKVTEDLTLGNNSFISARAFKNADGGNLNIDARFIVAFPNQIDGNGNDIIASAAKGDGGDISINAESLFGIQARKTRDNNQTNDIDASSEFGLNGTVSIFTPDINPIQGATELPSNVAKPEQITSQQACQANRESNTISGLNIKGRDGVTPAPDLPLNSQNIIDDETNAHNIPEPIETSQGKIQPARGIKVAKDGRIILTAYRTNDAGERIPEIKPNCSNTVKSLEDI